MSLKTFYSAKKPLIYGVLLSGVVGFFIIRAFSGATTTPYPSNRCSQYVHDPRTYGLWYNRMRIDSVFAFPQVGDTVTADTCHTPQLYSLGFNNLWWYDGHRNFPIAGISVTGLTGAANGLTDSANTALLGGLMYKSTDIETPNDTSIFSYNFNNVDDQQPFFILDPGGASMGYNVGAGAAQTVLVAAGDIGFVGGTIYPAAKLEAPNFTQTDSSTGLAVLGDSIVYYDDNISTGVGVPWVSFTHGYTRIKQLATTNVTAFVQADALGRLTSTSINQPHTIFVPLTGGTVNLVNNAYNVINPAGALATLTMVFPSSPSNGDQVSIKYEQAIGTITFTGGTVVGQTNTVKVFLRWVYDAATTSWY